MYSSRDLTVHSRFVVLLEPKQSVLVLLGKEVVVGSPTTLLTSSSSMVLPLSGWTPLTTRLLRGDGVSTTSSTAWNYWDDPDETRAGRLRQELQGWWDRLVPARTTTEASLGQQIAGLLLLDTAGSTLAHTTSVEEQTPSPVRTRGDRSIYVDRTYRTTDDFRRQLPGLVQLIASVEHTATTHLCGQRNNVDDEFGSFELDLSQTSVQLAEYPGDGSSHYPRHLDVPHNDAGSRTPQRILTVVYYLTDPDWLVVHDGGCLRLFHNGQAPCTSTSTVSFHSSYTDIAPYAGRMVIFRSDWVEHAVQPCFRRPRRAVTIWLYGTQQRRQPQQPPEPGIKFATDNLLPSRPRERAILEEQPNTDSQTSTSNEPSRINGTTNTAENNSLLPPPLPFDLALATTEHTKSTIFVSIASYRDSETGPTIRHLMATARFPERIRVGLVLQIDTQPIGVTAPVAVDKSNTSSNNFQDQRDIVDQLPTREPWWYERVRVLQLDARHATGPCLARALCQQGLYRGEEYMLQIDAHMRFRPNWDVYLIQQLQQCPDPTKAVLTTYPVGYSIRHTTPIRPNSNNKNTPNETRGTLLVPWKFDGDGMLRIRGRLFQEQLPCGRDEPVPCHLYAAGFNFCVAQGVLRDCPYDGSLHHLFFGEEMSMTVRLFTWGYDLLAPAQTVVYHLWERDHRPSPLSLPKCHDHDPYAGNAAAEERAKALQRVRKQLLGRGEGIGSVRTVLELEATLGVNFDDLKNFLSKNEYEIKCGVTFAKSASSGIDFFVSGLGTNTKSLILEFLG